MEARTLPDAESANVVGELRGRDKHVLALESDNGMLPFKGWGFNGTQNAHAVVQQIGTLLKSLGGDVITDHFDGADIQASVRAGGIPAISPELDMHRYFVVHHTPADTVDKIDSGEMARCIAAITSMAYVVADMPETLERSQPSAGRGGGPVQ